MSDRLSDEQVARAIARPASPAVRSGTSYGMDDLNNNWIAASGVLFATAVVVAVVSR